MKKFLLSFVYAFNGIKVFLKEDRNAILHVIAAVAIIILGIGLYFSETEWLVVILSIGAVIAAEMFNSAIERIVDMISPEHNEKAGKIKDMAAGAVLVISTAAMIIGIMLIVNHTDFFS
jgi:diacylglycerol kinase (ATP)